MAGPLGCMGFASLTVHLNKKTVKTVYNTGLYCNGSNVGVIHDPRWIVVLA